MRQRQRALLSPIAASGDNPAWAWPKQRTLSQSLTQFGLGAAQASNAEHAERSRSLPTRRAGGKDEQDDARLSGRGDKGEADRSATTEPAKARNRMKKKPKPLKPGLY